MGMIAFTAGLKVPPLQSSTFQPLKPAIPPVIELRW